MQKNSQFPDGGQPPELATSNPHTELHKQFNNKRLFERLKEKHTPKPYWKQFRTMYFAVYGASFLFNALSACTAAALVYFFIFGLTGSVIASGVMTATGLAVLEFLKRETSAKLFHTYLQFKTAAPGLIAAAIALAAISTTAAYFGAEATVKQFTPPPVLMDESAELERIDNQIKSIDEQMTAAQANNWKGIMTNRAQKTAAQLTAAKERLTAERIRIRERTDTKNDQTEQQHTQTTTANGQQFAVFTLISEIMLLICLYYLQYYDWRSFAEYAHAQTTTGQPTELATSNPHTDRLKQKQLNGEPAKIGFVYGLNKRATQNVTERKCERCSRAYIHGHARQKYCSDTCRVESWQERTGRRLSKKPKA
jgi:hypothetical protein